MPIRSTLVTMFRARVLLVLTALAVAAAACTYETVGTTTTTTLADDEGPPPTSGADIIFTDQRIEGSSVIVDSVTLPATGFVVLREDVAGSPGALVGLSEVIGPGRIDLVPVAFFVPLDDDAVIHAAVHIDIDRDRTFLYEPEDSFVDVPATRGDGTAASNAAEVVLLPPLGPAVLAVDEQRLTGTELDVGLVTLPAPGFVVVQRNEAGQPGLVLGSTDLLSEGTWTDLTIALDPALRTTGLVWIIPYVDRDEDGAMDVDDGDEPAELADGSAAAASPVMTVVPLDPSLVFADDQEGEGATIVVSVATFANPGFIEVLADRNGIPGSLLARTALITEATVSDVEIILDQPLDADTTIWLRLAIDFDQDQALTATDMIGLDEDGQPAQTSFRYTYVEPPPPDDEDDESDQDA